MFLHFRATWISPAIYGDSRKFRETWQVCLHIKERNNINSLEKKNIYQKFGGAMAPWPTPGYATVGPLRLT